MSIWDYVPRSKPSSTFDDSPAARAAHAAADAKVAAAKAKAAADAAAALHEATLRAQSLQRMREAAAAAREAKLAQLRQRTMTIRRGSVNPQDVASGSLSDWNPIPHLQAVNSLDSAKEELPWIAGTLAGLAALVWGARKLLRKGRR